MADVGFQRNSPATLGREHEESGVTVEEVVCDPRGDFRLVTNRDKHHQIAFKVHSKVLVLASEVFATLLSPDHSRGIVLADEPADALPELLLPDDDAHGMRIVFQMLHFREITQHLGLSELERVALVVHKYQCQQAFRAHSATWIYNMINTELKVTSSLPRYLCIAYAFDQPDFFGHFALGLAMTTGKAWNEPDVETRMEECLLVDLIPGEVYQSISMYADTLHNDLTAKLMGLIKTCNGKKADPTRPIVKHHGNRKCQHDEAVVAGFFRILQQEGVLPPREGAVPVLRST